MYIYYLLFKWQRQRKFLQMTTKRLQVALSLELWHFISARLECNTFVLTVAMENLVKILSKQVRPVTIVTEPRRK